MTSKQNVMTQGLKCWRLWWLERETVAALVFWEPNCDPGRFEVMLDAMIWSQQPVACGKDTLIKS